LVNLALFGAFDHPYMGGRKNAENHAHMSLFSR
jgi:hypothetical protein